MGQDLWLGTTPPPASLTIDFGDGRGPLSVGMNSTIDLGYNETPPTQPGPGLESRRAATSASLATGASLGTITVTNPTTGLQALSTISTLSTLAAAWPP